MSFGTFVAFCSNFNLRSPKARVMLDSWVVSQIWLDSDSNESSQSWVGRENQGYESSQSRIMPIVIWVELNQLNTAWVKVESLIFLKRKR